MYPVKMMLSYGPRVNPQGVARYLTELHHIHSVFRDRDMVHYTHELETDLVTLQLQMDPELPPLVQQPYISQYAMYLESLPQHTLLSHWFGLVMPAMLIPDAGCLINGPHIPSKWVSSSAYFHVDDDLYHRTRYMDEVTTMTPLQRAEFVEEFAEVSVRVYCLVSHLLVL